MKVVWSKRALERVEEIALYIARDDSQAAIDWTLGLFDSVEWLAQYPRMGRPARDVEAEGIRELVYGAFRVFYQVSDAVEVITVRRGSEALDECEFRG
jgi:toxin ParE1/3/4